MRDKYGLNLQSGDFIKYLSLYGVIIDEKKAYLLNSADNKYYVSNFIPRECELKNNKTFHEKELYDEIMRNYHLYISNRKKERA